MGIFKHGVYDKVGFADGKWVDMSPSAVKEYSRTKHSTTDCAQKKIHDDKSPPSMATTLASQTTCEKKCKKSIQVMTHFEKSQDKIGTCLFRA